MGFEVTNEYQKQRFSLSQYAYAIIKSDMLRFEYDKRGQKDNLGGFLNSLLFNLYNHPIISEYPLYNKIEKIIDAYFTEIVNAKGIQNYQKKSFVKALSNRITPEISSDRYKDLDKKDNEQVIFRIDNANLSILKTLSESEYFDHRLSKYLNFIFESYSRQSSSIREQILNRVTCEKVIDAIKEKVLISIEFKDGSVHRIIPYELYEDPKTSFNYLLGIQDSIKTPIRVRLSSIKHMSVHYSEKRSENPTYDIAIKNMHGANPLSKFIIELNPFGENQLNNQVEGRPKFDKLNDGRYQFFSTENEILYYFIKFGPNAKIIEPVETKQKFITIFELSLKNYL